MSVNSDTVELYPENDDDLYNKIKETLKTFKQGDKPVIIIKKKVPVSVVPVQVTVNFEDNLK